VSATAFRPGERSLTRRILAGLALGIAIGLFFGERAEALRGFADAYVGLMQMTVLPYLTVAIVLGIGRLERAEALSLLKYGGAVLVVLWALALAVVGFTPLIFPDYKSAFFFSTTMIEQHEPLPFVDLYIPANPFHSLANNVVPAVTLFSAAIGVGLIGLEGKERLLDPLSTAMEAITRVTHFVVSLTPLGVIPIAAHAAGTMSIDELLRLQVYFATFAAAAVLLGLVLLPLLVSATTPFRFAEVVSSCRNALLTAFVTNNVFIVLPMIVEASGVLTRRLEEASRDDEIVPEALVPIAFNLPTAGKLLALLFVPFAAWLAGGRIDVGDLPTLFGAGLMSSFAKAQIALPFLMDLMEVPHDLFQLYIPAAIVTGKFDSMVGAMSLHVFALLTIAAIRGQFRLRPAPLARFAVGSAAAVTVSLLVTKVALAAAVGPGRSQEEVLREMHLNRHDVPMIVHRSSPPDGEREGDGVAGLSRIRERGTLRVGYIEGRIPFSFFNAAGELVGFDIETTARMAKDLDVDLELVPTDWQRVQSQLEKGEIDVAPSAPYTHHWVTRLRMSAPYLDATMGLLVKDSRREEFATIDAVRSHRRLRLGVLADRDLWEDYIRDFLGGVPFELETLTSWQDVFEGRHRDLDAVITWAEIGMAWSLIHPEYIVAIPKPDIIRRPVGFALARGATELGEFVDAWVTLQKARGEIDRAYEYWILGKGAGPRTRRWSIAHDVLGWLD
jgi:Na+/H+-dicarboxylate symporter